VFEIHHTVNSDLRITDQELARPTELKKIYDITQFVDISYPWCSWKWL